MRLSEKNSIWNPVEVLADKKLGHSKEALPPVTMAAIWNFGVYEKPGSPSIRGLGGRIYFYDANNNAVAAEGELTVYGFDEDNGNQSKPDKKFIFRESEMQSHYSESSLGGSYSVWIPWDKVGGHRKSVTLLPMFKTTDGKLIKSEQSINLLAGKVKKETSPDSKHPYRVLGSSSAVLGEPSDNRPEHNNVARASFNQSGGDGDDDSGAYSQKIRTTEISLTPNLQRQVELAAQIRAGKNPLGDPAPQSAAPHPTAAAPVHRASVIPPTAGSSGSKGVFGTPGTFY